MIAVLAGLLVLLAPGAAAGQDVRFGGPKADPWICVGEGQSERCCGTKEGCRGPEFLHPALRPVASCLVEKLGISGGSGACEAGLRESFRSAKIQDSYKSVPGGWSFHNYGLAFDVCSYFKSGDCSAGNHVNKVVGGVVAWIKGGKVRCQAAYRKKGSGPSDEVSAKVQAHPLFPEVLARVRGCYEQAGVRWGEHNWGAYWKDYFDAPHFQYYASSSAGYYKKKKALEGPHVLVRLLADCYGGSRRSLLEDLYAASDPTDFIRSRKDGCGAGANLLFDEYVAGHYTEP